MISVALLSNVSRERSEELFSLLIDVHRSSRQRYPAEDRSFARRGGDEERSSSSSRSSRKHEKFPAEARSGDRRGERDLLIFL